MGSEHAAAKSRVHLCRAGTLTITNSVREEQCSELEINLKKCENLTAEAEWFKVFRTSAAESRRNFLTSAEYWIEGFFFVKGTGLNFLTWMSPTISGILGIISLNCYSQASLLDLCDILLLQATLLVENVCLKLCKISR